MKAERSDTTDTPARRKPGRPPSEGSPSSLPAHVFVEVNKLLLHDDLTAADIHRSLKLARRGIDEEKWRKWVYGRRRALGFPQRRSGRPNPSRRVEVIARAVLVIVEELFSSTFVEQVLLRAIELRKGAAGARRRNDR